MIYNTREFLRASGDLLIWAQIARWFNDRPAGRWYTLVEIQEDPAITLSGQELHWLLNGWLGDGILEQRVDSGRSLWRASPMMPSVGAIDHEEPPSERQLLGDLLNARLALGSVAGQ